MDVVWTATEIHLPFPLRLGFGVSGIVSHSVLTRPTAFPAVPGPTSLMSFSSNAMEGALRYKELAQ